MLINKVGHVQFSVFLEKWNSTTCLHTPGFPCKKWPHPYLNNLCRYTPQTMLRHWLAEGWFMYSQNELWN